MVDENNEPIVLESSASFENRHASGWFFLGLFIIPLFILWLGHMLFKPESFMSTAFMLIGAAGFLVVIILYTADYKATVKHMSEIRKMKFKFTSNASLDDVYNKIELALRHFHGDKVKFSLKTDCVTVTYKGINYKIILNGDATFSIHWQKSVFDNILSFLAKFNDNSEDEAEPTWKYNKIRTETPIIAYELQQAFNVTSTSEDKPESPTGQPLRARDIFINTKETSSPTKPVTANDSENSRKKSQSILDKILRHKIIFVGIVALTGLMIMIISYKNPTPKTIDQFIVQYNKEIKRTAGAVDKDKYHGRGKFVKSCTLDNVRFTEGEKYHQWLFGDRRTGTFFYGREIPSLNPKAHPIEMQFTFYEYATPVEAIFPIIEATIAASGEEEENIAKALGILKGNQYSIPYGYEKTVMLEDKSYSIIANPSTSSFSFRVVIFNQ